MSSSDDAEVMNEGTGKRNKNESDHGAAAASFSTESKRIRLEDAVNAFESPNASAAQQVSTVAAEAWNMHAEDDLLRNTGLEDVFAEGKGSEIRKAIVEYPGGMRAVWQIIKGGEFQALYRMLRDASGIDDAEKWGMTWGKITPVVEKAVLESEQSSGSDVHFIHPLSHKREESIEITRAFCDWALERPGVGMNGGMLQNTLESMVAKSFIFVEEPSGRGKTQAYFALKRAFRFLLTCALGQSPQPINTAGLHLATSLLNCIRLDLPTFAEGHVVPLAALEMRTLVQLHWDTPFWTAGLIYAVLDDAKQKNLESTRDIAMHFVSLSQQLGCMRRKISELERFAGEVIVFDEVPSVDIHDTDQRELVDPILKIVFVRNICRLAGLKVILMGTDATAANIVTSGQASRTAPTTEGGEAEVWCTVVHRLAPFVPSSETEGFWKQNEVLREVVTRANPWFANQIYERLVKTFGEMSTPPVVGALDEMRKMIRDIRNCKIKGQNGTAWNRGQLLMICAVSNSSSVSLGVIDGHFARLDHPGLVDAAAARGEVGDDGGGSDSQASFQLTATDAGVAYKGKKWHPSCRYEGSDVDPSLHLCLGGGPDSECHPLLGTTVYDVVQEMKAALDSRGRNAAGNDLAVKRDGDQLEFAAVSAMVMASRLRAFSDGSTPIDDWLLEVWRLLRPSSLPTPSWATLPSSKWTKLSDLSVPYLSRPGSDWGPLDHLPFLGKIRRPPNGEMMDFTFSLDGGKSAAGDAKNYKSDLDTPTLIGIVNRCQAADIIFVVTNHLQTDYFTEKDIGGDYAMFSFLKFSENISGSFELVRLSALSPSFKNPESGYVIVFELGLGGVPIDAFA